MREGVAGATGSDYETSSVPLIVSLTTLPSRIIHLRPTLESLRDQSRAPDQILLCLPDRSVREDCAYPRPEWLSEFAPLVQVLACSQDDGPGTKLLGCLPHLPGPSCLVIVDDDHRYKPWVLDELYEAQTRNPQSSFSFWTYRCGPFVVGQAADGFSFFTPNLAGIEEFAAAVVGHPSLRLVDDLWISAFLHKTNVPVQSLRHRITGGGNCYEPSHALGQLHQLTGHESRDVVMSSGSRYLQESGLVGRRLQAEALLRKVARAALRMVGARTR
jgi:hypothetical protein